MSKRSIQVNPYGGWPPETNAQRLDRALSRVASAASAVDAAEEALATARQVLLNAKADLKRIQSKG